MSGFVYRIKTVLAVDMTETSMLAASEKIKSNVLAESLTKVNVIATMW